MEIHAVPNYLDRQHGAVEVTDDVANVVRDIHAISPRIHVFWNEQTDEFDLVEHCLDETHRLIFSVQSLDARVVNRLRIADQWHGREDPSHPLEEDGDFLSKIDEDDGREEAERNEEHLDRIREAGERLAWAGEMDRRGVGAQIRIKEKPWQASP
jgi:hypothetical protein